MTTTKTVVVDDTDTSNIQYSSGWITCPGDYSCSTSQIDEERVYKRTWHQAITQDAELSLNFTFKGPSVGIRGMAASQYSGNTMIIQYSLDQDAVQENQITIYRECNYNQTLLLVRGLTEMEHTLRVTLGDQPWAALGNPLVFLVDSFVYEEEDPTAGILSESISYTPTAVPASSGTSAPMDTSANSRLTYDTNEDRSGGTYLTSAPSATTSISGDQTGSTCSITRTAVGLVFGGIGTCFILAIAGVLWYRSKTTSRRDESRADKPSPSHAPPNPKSSSMITYDPPGYTEKNIYLGIQSSLANHGASSPPDPEKGPSIF